MYKLVIGNKNYSSWSLRPWILMKVLGIQFEEINIPIYTPEGKQQLLEYSDAGKVPILITKDLKIWDSLAIFEYLAEQHPEKALWPMNTASRAIARSIANEMHSSFTHVRNQLPMNCRLKTELKTIDADLQRDVDRICQLWSDCRNTYSQQGDFLFGNFSIVDAMFAPVVLRFNSYGIPVEDIVREYMDKVLSLHALQEWIAAGKQESTRVAAYEID